MKYLPQKSSYVKAMNNRNGVKNSWILDHHSNLNSFQKDIILNDSKVLPLSPPASDHSPFTFPEGSSDFEVATELSDSRSYTDIFKMGKNEITALNGDCIKKSDILQLTNIALSPKSELEVINGSDDILSNMLSTLPIPNITSTAPLNFEQTKNNLKYEALLHQQTSTYDRIKFLLETVRKLQQKIVINNLPINGNKSHKLIQYAQNFDPELTENSSEDESVEPDDISQTYQAWEQTRSSYAKRWIWLQHQILDLDMKINHQKDINKHLKAVKTSFTPQLDNQFIADNYSSINTCARCRPLSLPHPKRHFYYRNLPFSHSSYPYHSSSPQIMHPNLSSGIGYSSFFNSNLSIDSLLNILNYTMKRKSFVLEAYAKNKSSTGSFSRNSTNSTYGPKPENSNQNSIQQSNAKGKKTPSSFPPKKKLIATTQNLVSSHPSTSYSAFNPPNMKNRNYSYDIDDMDISFNNSQTNIIIPHYKEIRTPRWVDSNNTTLNATTAQSTIINLNTTNSIKMTCNDDDAILQAHTKYRIKERLDRTLLLKTQNSHRKQSHQSNTNNMSHQSQVNTPPPLSCEQLDNKSFSSTNSSTTNILNEINKTTTSYQNGIMDNENFNTDISVVEKLSDNMQPKITIHDFLRGNNDIKGNTTSSQVTKNDNNNLFGDYNKTSINCDNFMTNSYHNNNNHKHQMGIIKTSSSSLYGFEPRIFPLSDADFKWFLQDCNSNIDYLDAILFQQQNNSSVNTDDVKIDDISQQMKSNLTENEPIKTGNLNINTDINYINNSISLAANCDDLIANTIT